MKGDFSRDTFDPANHFSRVLQQQGRVQLDADWNEQAAILLHYMRTLAADLIGPFAGPAGEDYGFKIGPSEKDDFSIGKGRYYVDGILCENEKEDVTYMTQKAFPPSPELPKLASGTRYLVYLDVWERHITALEDDDIREKALGGPDTATRTKVVWQVKIDDGKGQENTLPLDNCDTVRENWATWIARWQPQHLGCLKARIDRPEDSQDPCLTAPDAKYRGQENQLYRVEIHQGGTAGYATFNGYATFKWSRDNGAVVSRVEQSGAELVAEKPLGFAAGIWVELSNDGQDLRGQPGKLVKLLKVDGDRLTLEKGVPPKPADVPGGEDWPTKARRWDQRQAGSLTLTEGAVPLQEALKEADWVELENGIQIQFLPAHNPANRYRPGDYWLIPARVVLRTIEWPVKLNNEGQPERDKNNEVIPIPQAPLGIRHHYAPLAILDANGYWEDCRCHIPPLNDPHHLPSFGEEGMGGRPLCDATNPTMPGV
jgi:hypothetical protein